MKDIQRDFQASIDEARKAGRKPWGKERDIEIVSIGGRFCCATKYSESHLVYTLAELLFGDSGFLDMIERKKDDPAFKPNALVTDTITIETWGHNNGALYVRNVRHYVKADKSYHAMFLAAIAQADKLSVDEARMKYVLDNMEGFINKK